MYTYTHDFYSKMNDRVQPDSWSSWSSNWHGQRAAPASPVVVNTNNEGTPTSHSLCKIRSVIVQILGFK